MSVQNELVKAGFWASAAQALSDAIDTLVTAAVVAANTALKLSDFAATTSAELLTVISDATGTGALMFAQAPVFRYKVATVAAAGTTAANGGVLTEATFHLVTGADDTKGVVLPAAAAGKWVAIKVGDGADLKVWPATGDAINALSADAAMTVVDDVGFFLICLDGTTWYTLPLLPS